MRAPLLFAIVIALVLLPSCGFNPGRRVAEVGASIGRHVDVGVGSNANPGTSAQPFKTITENSDDDFNNVLTLELGGFARQGEVWTLNLEGGFTAWKKADAPIEKV